jgi:hypothetical protein
MGQKEDHLHEKAQQKQVEQMNLKIHLNGLSPEYRYQVSIGDDHHHEMISLKHKLLQEIDNEVHHLDLKTIQNTQDILTFACISGSHTENKRRAIALCKVLQSQGRRFRITSGDIANHSVYS